MFEKKVLNVYSIIIGLFFIVSGLGKVTDTTAFSNLIYQYGLGDLQLLSPLIVVVEILLGLFLVLLINPKRNSFYSFSLLTVFTLAFAYGHFKHGVNDCGCFGTLQPATVSPLFTFSRNFILIIMTLILWVKYPKEDVKTSMWKKYLIYFIICPAIFIAGFTYTIPNYEKPSSDKHKFLNQNIKNTELSKYIKTSKDSSYLIYCFSYTCPHCWNSIENLREYKTSNTVDTIIAFAIGADSIKLFFEKNFHPDFFIKDLQQKEMNELTDIYPTAFYVVHDSIKAVIEGELPSHVIFKDQHNLSNNK